jgi:hypothetical protein
MLSVAFEGQTPGTPISERADEDQRSEAHWERAPKVHSSQASDSGQAESAVHAWPADDGKTTRVNQYSLNNRITRMN